MFRTWQVLSGQAKQPLHRLRSEAARGREAREYRGETPDLGETDIPGRGLGVP